MKKHRRAFGPTSLKFIARCATCGRFYELAGPVPLRTPKTYSSSGVESTGNFQVTRFVPEGTAFVTSRGTSSSRKERLIPFERVLNRSIQRNTMRLRDILV